jgi:hypothetical protein
VPTQAVPALHSVGQLPVGGGNVLPSMGMHVFWTQAMPEAQLVPPQLLGSEPVSTGSHWFRMHRLFAGHALLSEPHLVGLLTMPIHCPERQNCPVPQPLGPHSEGRGPEMPRSIGLHWLPMHASPVVQVAPPQSLGSLPVSKGRHCPCTQRLFAGQAIACSPHLSSSPKMSTHKVPTRT